MCLNPRRGTVYKSKYDEYDELWYNAVQESFIHENKNRNLVARNSSHTRLEDMARANR